MRCICQQQTQLNLPIQDPDRYLTIISAVYQHLLQCQNVFRLYAMQAELGSVLAIRQFTFLLPQTRMKGCEKEIYFLRKSKRHFPNEYFLNLAGICHQKRRPFGRSPLAAGNRKPAFDAFKLSAFSVFEQTGFSKKHLVLTESEGQSEIGKTLSSTAINAKQTHFYILNQL